MSFKKFNVYISATDYEGQLREMLRFSESMIRNAAGRGFTFKGEVEIRENEVDEPTPAENAAPEQKPDSGVGSSDWLALGWPVDLYANRTSFGAWIYGAEATKLFRKYDKDYSEKLQTYLEMEAAEGNIYEDEEGVIRFREFPGD